MASLMLASFQGKPQLDVAETSWPVEVFSLSFSWLFCYDVSNTAYPNSDNWFKVGCD